MFHIAICDDEINISQIGLKALYSLSKAPGAGHTSHVRRSFSYSSGSFVIHNPFTVASIHFYFGSLVGDSSFREKLELDRQQATLVYFFVYRCRMFRYN